MPSVSIKKPGYNTTGKKGKKGTGGDKVSGGQNHTGTETDTFSQIITIHKNQEELLDLE